MSTAEERRDRGRCIFCTAFASPDDRATYTLWRGHRCFALLNAYPYTSGHAMVAPVEHVATLEALDRETMAEMMAAARALTLALGSVYGPHGFNLGLNLGEAAGAGIEDHLHLHVVPRWRGDTNFMSTVADVRVIPESLEAAFEKVRSALAELTKREGWDR